MADKEVITEWKRYLESDDYRHNPECGTLLIAMHFAEWGKQHQMPVSEDLEEAAIQYTGHNAPYDEVMDEVQEAFCEGAKWQKQQMIKDAINGYIVEETIGHGSMALGVSVELHVLEKRRFKEYDKVKIIIIKEE